MLCYDTKDLIRVLMRSKMFGMLGLPSDTQKADVLC